MCGINLVLDRTGNLPDTVLDSMLQATEHRGPHNKGKIIKRRDNWLLFLGVNRLRITDNDEQSDQPFSKTDNNQYLLFNGEIYNYPELKNELLNQGIRFDTSSDTEIVYRFFQKKQLNNPERLNGMFAIIYVDLNKNEIIITRDRWGMKPLYFYKDEKYFIISSEIRGILATGLIKKEINTKQISHYLRYRYTAPDETFYKNIYPIEKGICARYNIEKNSWIENAYIQNGHNRNFKIDEKEILKRTESLLVDSIITHTNQRFPAGLMLSGGVDSTLLLALARKHQLKLPYLFSIFERKKNSAFATKDKEYSKKAAGIFGGQEIFIEYDESILNDLPELISNMDHPVADGAALLTYLITRKVHSKTHVVLSGAGADELFAGYNRHMAFSWYLKKFPKIQSLIKPITVFFNYVPLGKNIPGRKKLVLLKKFIQKIDKNPYRTYDNFMSFDIFPETGNPEKWKVSGEEFYYEENLSRALERDRNEYLPEDVLAVNDRFSMLNHVEMRMPYLDLHLSEFIKTLPAESLLKNGPKWIIKEILASSGGKIFSRRSKEGFGFSFGLWLRRKKNYHLIEYIRNKDTFLEPYLAKSILHNMLNEHLSGKADNSQEIWSILILLLWIDNNFS